MIKQIQQTTRMLFTGLVFTIAAYSQAADLTEVELKVSSIGQTKAATNIVNSTAPTLEQRKAYWQEHKQALLTNSTTLTKPVSLGTTRDEHLLLKQSKKQARKATLSTQAKENNFVINAQSNFYHYDSFSIYDAFSYLLDDIDGDGYYQSFSIAFDADFYTTSIVEHANVYAELYLSKDGGPWVHYYSTEVFTIYGESDADEYEVMTTLEQGFSSGYYDVLIDLYDADYEELVVSYSSDDNNALYALPVESNDYDQPYEVEVIHTHGGSTSYILFALMALLVAVRLKQSKSIKINS